MFVTYKKKKLIMRTFKKYYNDLIKEAELSQLQKKYKDFFLNKLKEYGVESPAELDEETRSKFFTEIQKEWPNEKNEE